MTKRIGKLLHAGVRVAIGVSVNWAFHASRHDLLVAVIASGVFDDGRDHQGLIHHLAEH